jgi:predicted nucleic acid-binding protein
MKGFLLDTNIVSEIRKGAARAHPGFWKWWLGMSGENLFLSVLTLGEIRKGIALLAARDPAQSVVLEKWLHGIRAEFAGQLLEITPAVADRWGCLQAIRPLPDIDALLAATALDHDLTLVTRNTADFSGLGLRLLNPFHDA